MDGRGPSAKKYTGLWILKKVYLPNYPKYLLTDKSPWPNLPFRFRYLYDDDDADDEDDNGDDDDDDIGGGSWQQAEPMAKAKALSLLNGLTRLSQMHSHLVQMILQIKN